MTLKPTSSQGSGGGGSVEVTDGVTTVNPASELDFTSGVVVTDGGGGNAQLAVSGSGGGTVTAVSSANTSISVATGTTTPVLTVGTADKLFTNHAPIAAVALNAQKITGLANGSSAQDGAAFGQIPTALPPNGTAGGDLSGSYPNPAVKAITETSGPTDLVIGTITDGQFLKRTGSTLVSAAGGTGTVTNVTSADTSISVATGTTTPALTVAALNTIAANHATSGSVAMNSNKITGLANGSTSTDAAAFGQIPTALPVLSAVLSRAVQVGGSLTIASTSTTSAEMAAATGGPGTGGFDLTIAAATGDYLLITAVVNLQGLIVNQQVGIDIATIVSSAAVNWIGQSAGAMVGTNEGLAFILNIGAGTYSPLTVSTHYVVQSGDISGGNVVLRPYYGSNGAHGNIARSVVAGPLIMGVTNLKH